MTIRVNPELAAILAAANSQYAQVRALNTALTTAKRVKAKRVADASMPQADVWANGVLFRDAALLGNFTFQGSTITGYGKTSDLTVCLAADLSTGKSVLRIEGGGHWIEGTFGLEGSGADFTFPTNPTATNSIAIAGSFRIRANQLLPDGTPDLEAPQVSISAADTVTTVGAFPITATLSDDVGVARVDFFRDETLLGTKTEAPWTYNDNLALTDGGNMVYTIKAYDAANNEGVSVPKTVAVDIVPPVETGPVVAVGALLTDVTVQSTSASAQSNVPVTFAQVFAVGALPANGAAVDLRAPNNTLVTCQLDVKSTHPDGSVRLAMLSAIIPTLAGSASVVYGIVRRAAPPAGTPAAPSDFPSLTAVASITETGVAAEGPIVGATYTADAGPLLAAGTYETYLSGPVVSEWIVRAPYKTSGGAAHADMYQGFSIRAYKGQNKAKVDFAVEHCLLKKKSTTGGSSAFDPVGPVTVYRPVLTLAGSPVYSRAANGYHRVPIQAKNAKGENISMFEGNATMLPNNSTVYTATIAVDGVAKSISVTGSAAQTYGQLRAILNAQLGTATCNLEAGSATLRFSSNTTGAASSVRVTDYGTLFPALSQTGTYRPIQGDEVIHYPLTRWKKTYWWGTAPQVHIAHNKQYLISIGALPNYDPALTGDETVIEAKRLELDGNSDFNESGLSKPYMADVGAAAGIGLIPEWAAMAAVNQGWRAKENMLRQADIAGGWPVHWRDAQTMRPFSFIDWPMAALVGNTSDAANPATGLSEKLAGPALPSSIPPTRLIPETAHHPDFYFLPYLLTGDYFYLEGMLFYQRWALANQNPGPTKRDGSKCLFQDEQPRGQAWLFRTTSHAAYAIPTAHPLRADLMNTLNQNRIWYNTHYVSKNGQFHNALGIIMRNYVFGYRGGRGMAPWQDDFVTAAVGRCVELGFKEFLPMLKFKSKFLVGRFTSGPDYCWQLATGTVSITVKPTADGPLYSSYKEIYENSFIPEIVTAPCGSQQMIDGFILSQSQNGMEGVRNVVNSTPGYPDSVTGYPSNTQPAIAYAVTYGMQGAADAWLVFMNRAVKPNYNHGPQFAILPRV